MIETMRRYAGFMLRVSWVSAFIILFAMTAPARAQDSDLPYWASIRSEVVNMRVGPGTTYRIDWVYRRMQLPLKVIRRKDGWRLVEDSDGARGWMLGDFLSRERSAIVTGNPPAAMHAQADPASPLLWRLEPGVVAALGDCEAGWCEIGIRGRKGYVRQDRLWGAGKP
jgi:SH3-like domain-containing protein